jgi:hypothetical protein
VGKGKKLKIPREVGGVKVPKKLRKKAKQAVKLAKIPMARELAVAGLTAAAAALADSKEARRRAARVREEVDEAAGELRREAAKLGDVIRAAAIEGARRLLQEMEAVRSASGAGEESGEALAPKAKKKPNGSRAAGPAG